MRFSPSPSIDESGAARMFQFKHQIMNLRDRISTLLDDNLRTVKPRNTGITVVIDKGQMGLNTIHDFGAHVGEYCDFVKIAWGSALITGNLEEKLEAYRRAGVTPMFGGTLFEYVFLRGKVPQFLDVVRDLKVHVE